MADRTAAQIRAAVEERGVLLVHDQVLPSVTALVTGGPVRGSWWAHPMANTIYNALTALDDEVATVKLLVGKNTLVARRLWPDLVGIGLGRDPWQTDGLGAMALTFLREIEASELPVVAHPPRRGAGRLLERRLLVHATAIHTDAGHHVTGYEGWLAWAAARGVSPVDDSARARATFETVTASWPGRGRNGLLAWGSHRAR